MAQIQTQVSKAHPAIKKILRNTHYGDWRGRNVYVVQVDPSWSFRLYSAAGGPGPPRLYRLAVDANRATFAIPPPKYGTPDKEIEAPFGGDAIVAQERMIDGPVTIYVPELDAAILAVARDAMLAGDKKRAAQVLRDLGPYAGIGAAIVEAQSKTLEKVTSGKTSRQLDREIAEFLRTSKAGG